MRVDRVAHLVLGRALTLVLVASACTSAVPTPTTAPSEQPVRGGVIVEPIAQDIKTLQPVIATDSLSIGAVNLIYPGLVGLHPKTGQPRPELGEWHVSSDAVTYTWRIAHNAVWSDGRAITAADVVTTVKAHGRTKTPHPGYRPLMAEIEGFDEFASGARTEIAGLVIDPSDPKRFSLRLKRGSCLVPLQVHILPDHVFGAYLAVLGAIDTAPENLAPTVFGGPFKLEEWRREERVRFTRNPTYWKGEPYLGGYELKVLPPTAWVEQLRAGLLGFVRLADAEGAAQLDGDRRVKIHRTPADGYTFIGWNIESTSAPALRDKRVRQALAYGLDAETAMRQIFVGSSRNHAHHPPGWWGSPVGLSEYGHDPDRARALIEAAGYVRAPDGIYQKNQRELAVVIETNEGNPRRARLLQLVADQYRGIGVRVTAVRRPFNELLRRLPSDEVEGVILGLTNTVTDPRQGDASHLWHSRSIPDAAAKRTGSNWARVRSPAIDEALDRAANGPDCSLAERKKHYETLNRLLNEEQPFFFGFRSTTVRAVRSDLRGFGADPYEGVDVHLWWLAPEKK